MVKQRSPGFYRIAGMIGTSRVISRLHPHVYRLVGGRWFVGRNVHGVRNVIRLTAGRRAGHPRARLRIGHEVRDVRARGTDGDERETLWRLASAGYPGYELYRQMTDRRIPVVVLEPFDGTGA